MTDLWRMSATEIADAVRSKQLSAVEVTEAHLTRMDDVNPTIRACCAQSVSYPAALKKL
jgi:amidase